MVLFHYRSPSKSLPSETLCYSFYHFVVLNRNLITAYHFIPELQNHNLFFFMLRTSATWSYFNQRIKLALESQA